MFRPTSVHLTESYTEKKLSYILKVPGLRTGCLLETTSMDELVKKVTSARFIETKKLSHVSIYETEDLGRGIVDSLSSLRLKEYIAMKLLSEKTPVYLEYIYGNLFFLLDIDQLDEKLLLTDKVSFAYSQELDQVFDINIGSYVSPNRLYHLQKFSGTLTTLEKVLKNDFVTCFHLHSFSSVLSDLPQ